MIKMRMLQILVLAVFMFTLLDAASADEVSHISIPPNFITNNDRFLKAPKLKNVQVPCDATSSPWPWWVWVLIGVVALAVVIVAGIGIVYCLQRHQNRTDSTNF
jgi:predicted double-glycine peptidase